MSVTSGTETRRSSRARAARKPKTETNRHPKAKSKSKSKSKSTSSSSSKDRVALSSKARRYSTTDSTGRAATKPADTKPKKAAPTPEERRRQEENNHITNLDRGFEIFDNPGGGKTDGTVSKGDLEKVAKGDYDRDKAEERLKNAGVPSDKINQELKQLEKTADFLLENDSVRDRIDKAAAGNGKTDGKISRTDLDKIVLDVEREQREAKLDELERKAAEPPTQQHIEDAQNALDRWTEPGGLEKELKSRPLSEFSAPELEALAAVNQNNPEAQKQIEKAVLQSVDKAESLDQLPQGDAFSYLLQDHVTGQEVKGSDREKAVNPTAVAQRQLDALVKDEIEASLDKRLDDRKGDKGLDFALERVGGDIEDLAIGNPALIDSIQRQAESTFQEYGDEFTEVARRDDNVFQKANHAVTGGLREGVGFITDGFRDFVDVTARISSVPTRLVGKATNFALDSAGKLAGAGLDAVGADGVADNVRATADRAGDLAEGGANFLADQNVNFTNGLGESVAGAVDGIAYAVTDPVGTVKGLGQLVKDPSLILEGYKQTAEEHGVAGAAGQVAGDVLLTVFTGGGGAAAKGSAAAGRISSILSKGGRVSNVAARGASRTASFLDDAGRITGAARHSFRSHLGRGAQALDNLPGVSGARTRLAGLGEEGGLIARNIPESVKSGSARVRDILSRNDAPAFRRKSADFRAAHPELLDDIGKAQKAVEGLRGAGKSDLAAFIDDNLDLATRIDDLSSGSLPAGVGTAEVSGRANILRYLRDNIDTLDTDQVRRLTRGVLADSDPSAPVHLTRLGSGDQVFRAFDSKGNAGGSYFSPARDRRLSPRQQRANNALPDTNSADRGVLVTPGEDSLAIVSRVAPQFEGPGGGVQLQFLEPTVVRDLLDQIGDHLPGPQMPALPFILNNPSRFGRLTLPARPGVATPALAATDQEEQEQSSGPR